MSKAGSCTIIGGGLIATAGALALEELGSNVTVVTRAPPPLGGDSIEWTYGDVASQAAVHAVERAESVIYAAGTLGPATKLETVHSGISDEIVPVLKLAEQAAGSGCKTFVFISSGGTVYGPNVPLPTHEDVRTAPINIYGTIKVLTELALLEVGRKYGISIVILRVSNPYGPGQSGTRRMGFIAAAAKAAMAGEPIVIWGDGSTTRDFIFIDDVGRALALAAGYRGNSVILNIGSGEGHSLLQICKIVSSNSPRPLNVQFDSGRAFDVPKNYLDISRAAQVLGWRPQVALNDGIALLMKRGGI
ncbi:NAD-dependent epimerase/dehydratase family protein [Sphingobium xenophagum]|uniref:NAD-dependent epimerase/dehydratase family protein n=1 Tax=Sphingobium TaxID=165695 RepID=UPI002F2B9054